MKVANRIKPDVVIVDSGIDTRNSTLKNNIAGGICFQYDSNTDLITSKSEYFDENGHGTHCASIIKKLAPDASMYILKVLNKDAKTNSKTLIEALKHLADVDTRLINISLATTGQDYIRELKEICDLLYKRSKILVCSLDNREDSSYPASFENVIGVKASNFNFTNEFWYNSRLEIQCVADGLPIFVPGINNSYTLFGGNSKATALFTGIILNILNKMPDIGFRELNGLLEKKAVRNNWSAKDISRDFDPFEEITKQNKDYPEHELKKLENVIIETLSLQKDCIPLLYKNKLYHPKIGVNKLTCYKIIKNAEREFCLNLNYELISANTFNSIYTLLDFILLEGVKCQKG